MPDRSGMDQPKNPHAAALGRLGGLRGGPARAAALSETQRAFAAQFAARTRWTTRRYEQLNQALTPTTPTPPAKAARTHVLMIADMSGSMAPLAEDTRGGFNHYLDEIGGDGHPYLVSATLFNTRFQALFTERTPQEATRLDAHNYVPGDFTALLDAVGSTLRDFGELPAGDNAVVVIQTDGAENASREFGAEQVRQMVKERQDSGNWLFLFLGAGPETWSQAGTMGVSAATTFATPQTRHGTRRRYAATAAATHMYARTSDPTASASAYLHTPGAVDPAVTPPLGTILPTTILPPPGPGSTTAPTGGPGGTIPWPADAGRFRKGIKDGANRFKKGG